MRRIGFLGVIVSLAMAFAPGWAFAQDDDSVEMNSHRVVVQEGVFSVETPCPPDDLLRVERRGSPGVQCRMGPGNSGLGALVTRNGLTPNSGNDTFDSIYDELSADSRTGRIDLLEVAGKRATRATNPANGNMFVQIVELAERELAVLLFVGDPLNELADADDAERYARAVEFFETLEFVEE